MHLHELTAYTDQLLGVERFRDYCPNGLQVEGRATVNVIVTGVTASLALIEQAIALQADAIIVHHGYFWRNEDPRIVGIKQRRLAQLIGHEISLLAYHLPLDAHPELGNNARLGARLDFVIESWHGEQGLIALGRAANSFTPLEFSDYLHDRLGYPVRLLPGDGRPIRRIAWCTGGAQGYFEEAIRLKVDAYITGEAAEPSFHLAQESGVAFAAAGHHATERFGIEALGQHLAATFGLCHQFVDLPNPV